MIQGKKFISPGAWFSMIYPADWSEFEEGEGTFLFYNPDVWNGNFRISAYKEELVMNYGNQAIGNELKENQSAQKVTIGDLVCAYSKEMFEEDGEYYTTHWWITGIDNIAFQCSFTVRKGESAKPAESIIASLAIRYDGKKYPAEIIPVRLSEIFLINESYEWIVNTVKQEWSQPFQGTEDDLSKLQQIVDSGLIGKKKKDEWMAVGIALCVILANEVEGLQWMTLVDGNREAPILVYNDHVIDPMKLVWSKIKAGEPCNIEASYKEALNFDKQ